QSVGLDSRHKQIWVYNLTTTGDFIRKTAFLLFQAGRKRYLPSHAAFRANIRLIFHAMQTNYHSPCAFFSPRMEN
ncbi:MAG: hypothetical protein Q9M25_05040, partial [Mariprofundaceae bacterium]|nr:hypothetical protein [Mariprofundaceae bacterium]